MATETVYVDPVLGNDGTGTVDDPELPFEHIQAAVNAFTIGSDGIVILADGLYVEDSGGTNYLQLNRSLASLILTSVSTYGSTIRAAAIGGQPRVIHAAAPLTIVTIGRIVIDAENDQTAHITFDSSTAMSAIIDGTKFINCDTFVFNTTSQLTSFTMQGNWIASDAPRIGNFLTGETNAQVNISDGLIINDGVEFSANPILIDPTSSGVDVVIDGVDFSYTCEPTTTSHRYMLFIRGADTVQVRNCTLVFSDNGSTGTASGVVIPPDVTTIPSSILIEDNAWGSSQQSQLTYGVIIGSETVTSSHRIDGVVVRRNQIANADHAVMFGFITDAKSYSNAINNVVIGCLAKGTITCRHSANLVIDASGKSLYGKNDTNSIFANNTCVANSVTPDAHFYTGFNLTSGVDDSHGTLFVNNIIYDSIGDDYIIFDEQNSDAQYKNNNMFQPNGNSRFRFSYNGFITDDLALLTAVVNGFNPGTMSDNLEIDPEFRSRLTYELLLISPMVGAGLKWWPSPETNPLDMNGEPFWDAYVDIGAYSTWDGNVRRVPAPKRLAAPERSTSYRTPYTP